MQKWKYALQCFAKEGTFTPHEIESILNARGNEGWQLAAIHNINNMPVYFYKRPIRHWWQFWK